MKTHWRIGSLRLTDLEEVLEIERASYPNPWSRDLFLREHDNPRSSVDLLRAGEGLAGYLVSWRLPGEMHILNVATAPAFRRQGVARRLLRLAIDRARERSLERILLEVRIGNAGAIALYESIGFRRDGARRRYYPDGEDAVLMSLDVAGREGGWFEVRGSKFEVQAPIAHCLKPNADFLRSQSPDEELQDHRPVQSGDLAGLSPDEDPGAGNR